MNGSTPAEGIRARKPTHNNKPPISQRFPSLDAEDRRPLDVPAPYNHDSHTIWECFKVCSDWTVTFFTWLGSIWKWIIFFLRIKYFLLVGIGIFLAWSLFQHVVGNYICPSITYLCTCRYIPLSSLICPSEICKSYPSSTAEAAPPSMISIPTLYNHTEQQEYIRTLFRSPHSLHWSSSR